MQLSLTLGGQRWEERRHRFVPPSSRIRRGELDVAPIASDSVARAFVAAHHYSGNLGGPRRLRFGLYRRGTLVGVCVLAVPFQPKALRAIGAGLSMDDSLEISRFVLLPEIAFNGETNFLGGVFAQLSRRWRAIVSYSDPMPRQALDGRLVMPGHVGQIYQAYNAIYLGRGRTDEVWLLPDGTAFHPRGRAKIYGAQKCWRARVRHLVSYGAAPLSPLADAGERAEWFERWSRKLLRVFPHPGTHKYAWIRDRRLKRPKSLPYPRKAA